MIGLLSVNVMFSSFLFRVEWIETTISELLKLSFEEPLRRVFKTSMNSQHFQVTKDVEMVISMVMKIYYRSNSSWKSYDTEIGQSSSSYFYWRNQSSMMWIIYSKLKLKPSD